MKNLPRVLDHYDDNGTLLRKRFAGREVPAIIKTAADLSEVRQQYVDDYALVAQTPDGQDFRLPVVDAGNTVASALYFAEYGDQLEPEHRKVAAANLKSALESFGFEAPEELTKVASFELGYSGAADNASLEVLFGVTPDDPMEVVEDAFESFSPRGKRRLMMRIKEAGAMAPEGTEDYGRDEIGTDFAMALEIRNLTVMEKEATAQLAEIKKQAEANVSPDLLASELEVFDMEHNLTHLYGRRVPDPYASVFGTTLQVKEAQPLHVEVDGQSYTADTIREFAESNGDRVRESFGDDFAEQFQQDPVSVMHSLPSTHKQALARMI